MANFEIESNVEIPKRRHNGGGRTSKYPFARMEVGDSFVVDYQERGDSPERACRRVRQAANTFRKSHPDRQFIARIDEDGEPRCWRTA